MEISDKTKQILEENPYKNKVHKVLAHSYLLFFLLFLLSLFLDFIFPLKVFETFNATLVGAIFLFLGTILILWAQKSSLNLKKDDISKEIFYHGPYRYTRSPTHLGLFFLILGFGLINNAMFVVVFSIISFFVSKFVFIKKEEKILAERYGTPYIEYKKSVKF
jgi:protein-S-isoprenylcysteine O-methyltransferase Ste14